MISGCCCSATASGSPDSPSKRPVPDSAVAAVPRGSSSKEPTSESVLRQGTVRSGEYTPTSDAAPGRTLSNHVDRSGTTIHGRPSVAFGSVFAIVGVTLGLLAWQGQ